MDILEHAICSKLGGNVGGGGPQSIPPAYRAQLGMPSLNAATTIVGSDGTTGALSNYVTVLDAFSPTSNKMRIIFGKRNNAGTWVYPTCPVTDDGSTGSGFLKLITFPKGYVSVNTFVNLPVLISAATAWTCTTSVMSLGSAQAATDASLTGTEADIVASQTLKLLTYSSNAPVIGSVVSGSLTTVASRTAIFTNAVPAIGAAQPTLLDSTGGTSNVTLASGTVAATAGTLTTVAVNGTIASGIAIQNNFSTLAAQINAIAARIGWGNRFDGTTTALSVFLNFGVNSDPTQAITLSLGNIVAGSETVFPAGYIDFDYQYHGSGSSTAIFDIAAPLHGAGGG